VLPCKQRIAADTTATTDLSGEMDDRQKQPESLRYGVGDGSGVGSRSP